MRYAGRLFGHGAASVYLGGILVSWSAFTLAMVALFVLARLDMPRVRAERTALLTAIFPFGFFFGMVYTEALFLLLTVLAFYAFRTSGDGFSAVCVVALHPRRASTAFCCCRRSRGSPGEMPSRRRAIVCWPRSASRSSAAASPSTRCTCYQISGNPFEWAASISRWGYYPGGLPWLAPVRLVARLATHPYLYLTTDRIATYDVLYGVTGILSPSPCRLSDTLGAGYGLFMVANLWLPLSSGVFEGVGRYCSVLFPAFMLLATVRSRAVSTAIVVVFALFSTRSPSRSSPRRTRYYERVSG